LLTLRNPAAAHIMTIYKAGLQAMETAKEGQEDDMFCWLPLVRHLVE
jgi:hypothetical protein